MHSAVWPVRLRAFTGGDHNIFFCPSQDDRCQWPKDLSGSGGIALPIHVAYGYEPGERLLALAGLPTGTYFSYGYNIWGTSVGSNVLSTNRGLGSLIDASSPAALKATAEMPVSRVKVPSDMVALADATADGLWDFSISPNHSDPRLWPGKVHAGGANVLFCDGHVQWYAQSDLTFESGTIDPRSMAIARMWNNDHLPESVK
jgi:prepilin-type processing-associated H-X9-DG protein